MAFDLMLRVVPRVRNPQMLVLAAMAVFACELSAQSPGRSVRIPLSDSILVLIHEGGTDTSITAFTRQGIFRLRADSSALASWAKASAALPGPKPQQAGKSSGEMSFSATVLRASDGSGSAMQLARLSEDSLSEYGIAGSNGAWQFGGRIPPEKVGVLFRALAGSSGEGVTWNPDGPHRESADPDYRVPEPAPNNPAPRYPARAELAQAAGEVVAQFTVDTNGRALRETLLVVRSTHPLFSLAVRDALPEMRFHPATRSGAPVNAVVVQAFVFKIP
ncbi:MAG TPA: TonB family protein [Gemmatimonadaceae bacterium]|nr:TonB family protein [Gemmatimonadaceae bacterium]